jgi:hypothetical protein
VTPIHWFGSTGSDPTSSDLIAAERNSAANHGGFIAGVTHLTDQWLLAGLITEAQKDALQKAAARSR